MVKKTINIIKNELNNPLFYELSKDKSDEEKNNNDTFINS